MTEQGPAPPHATDQLDKSARLEDFVGWMEDLAAVAVLLKNAPVQRRYPLAVLRSRLFPCFWHRQYLLYRQNGHPVGFVNWAWMSPEKSAEYAQTQCLLTPEDWHGGSELWITEIIAGKQALGWIIRDFRTLFAPGTRLQWHVVRAGEPTLHRELTLPV